MLCPVLCTCGKSLAAYYAAFRKIRTEEMKKILQTHSAKNVTDIKSGMIAVSDDLNPMLGEFLDKMHITRECCRQIMITHVDFKDKF